MPQFRVNVKVEQKGTLFNAAASKAAANRAVVQVNEALAQEGVNRVQSRLRQVLKNPTGFYESRVQVERRATYRGFSDSNAVYGGWLEGTSSLNRSTRFKGYRTFRTVREGLNRDKAAIAAPIIRKLVEELST